VKTRLALAATAVAGAVLVMASRPAVRPLPGFARGSAGPHDALERRFLDLPSPDQMRATHRFLTREPHPAGSERNRELAEWTQDRFRAIGLDDVQMVTHDVLLPQPLEVAIEMITPAHHGTRWMAAAEAGVAALGPAALPYHAYSRSGDVTAPVIYAGNGDPEDYDWLAGQDIDVRGRIVLVRHAMPYSYRGFKVLTAERRGAAALLVYSDPADDGSAKGPVYPHGPWGPADRVQRGGIAYDFFTPGDPLTPGWPSTTGAKRLDPRDAASLPKIVSAPLSERDAHDILAAMDGQDAPQAWRGSLPIRYRLGSESTVLRVRVRSDERVRPIWTVTGLLRGRESPDDLVIVGNHRDAWLYGGVDPSSGSATMMELARALGELKKAGWRPRRSILFASWDAEEISLTSSTEWAEQHAQMLREHAVAYLNADRAVSGQELTIAAVPALNGVIESATSAVRDPETRLTLTGRVRSQAGAAGAPQAVVDNRIGGGSDYTVFLNHLGVPIADFSFRGPYGVYHSAYDTHEWVARIGDPGFRYHATLVQLLGLVTLRLADADLVPLDYTDYAARIDDFARDVRRRWTSAQSASPDDPMRDVLTAVGELRQASARFASHRDEALRDGDGAGLQALNAQLLQVERALLDAEGIPGRPWFRHLIYAPKFTYGPELLPGIAEALEAGDTSQARHQAQRLAAAIRRAAAALAGVGN
jgi:N-acetylated-alpha-linked acidic dipeptidase